MTVSSTSSDNQLARKTLAIIATDGFEKSELFVPKEKLEAMGADIDIISIDDAKQITSWDEKNWGEKIAVDKQISEAKVEEYDAVIIPGGQINPDILRTNKTVVSFLKQAASHSKIKSIAAICHGPWLLAEADLVNDKAITSYPSTKTDMVNAGGKWTDSEVVVDGKLVTSRNPDDLPKFVSAIASTLSQ